VRTSVIFVRTIRFFSPSLQITDILKICLQVILLEQSNIYDVNKVYIKYRDEQSINIR